MIVRIELYKFKARQGRVGLSHLREHVAFLARFKGCLEVHIARCPEDLDHYLVYSKWDGPESHGAMALQLRRSPEAQKSLIEVMPLLEREPTFGHFEVL